jgi:hypothetical protein
MRPEPCDHERAEHGATSESAIHVDRVIPEANGLPQNGFSTGGLWDDSVVTRMSRRPADATRSKRASTARPRDGRATATPFLGGERRRYRRPCQELLVECHRITGRGAANVTVARTEFDPIPLRRGLPVTTETFSASG